MYSYIDFLIETNAEITNSKTLTFTDQLAGLAQLFVT